MATDKGHSYTGRNDPYADHTGGSASETLGEAAQKAEEIADDARKHARVAARVSQRQVKNGLVAAEEFVRERPLAVVAGVAVLGLAIGALWKLPRRSQSWTDQAVGYVEPYYRSVKRRL